MSLVSPALVGGFFTTELLGKPWGTKCPQTVQCTKKKEVEGMITEAHIFFLNEEQQVHLTSFLVLEESSYVGICNHRSCRQILVLNRTLSLLTE